MIKNIRSFYSQIYLNIPKKYQFYFPWFLGVVFAIILIFFFMYPAVQWRSAQETFYKEQKGLYVWFLTHKDQFHKIGTKTNQNSLLLDINDAAARAQIKISRMEPNAQSEIKLWIDQVSFEKWLTFASLLKKSGLVLHQVSVEKADDSGQVRVALDIVR